MSTDPTVEFLRRYQPPTAWQRRLGVMILFTLGALWLALIVVLFIIVITRNSGGAL